jgi:hypothetical protein
MTTAVIWYGSNMIDNLCETGKPPLLGGFGAGRYASGGGSQASGMVAIPTVDGMARRAAPVQLAAVEVM